MDYFTTLITEICEAENIDCQPLSFGWILRLTRGGRHRHIVGRHFDLNPACADRIACDKYACYTLLAESGVPAVEHELFFDPARRRNWIEDEGEFARALRYFEKQGRKAVAKPNNGWQGKDVYACYTPKQLERAMLAVFQSEPNVCLCPFHDFTHEYRVFYVNGQTPYMYGKKRAYAVGDGVRSVLELAQSLGVPEESYCFPHPPEYVPEAGEEIRVSWKHNLSNGALAFDIADEAVRGKLSERARQAAAAINIRFAAVDIAEMDGGDLRVLEINAGVTANKLLEQHPEKREMIKGIYAEAVRAMFD